MAKKSRKGKVMKQTATKRKAQIDMKRRNPQFRKHEQKSRSEVTTAISYMTTIVNGEDPNQNLQENSEIVESMGGIEGVHEFLFFLDALKDDWEERLDSEGFLTVGAISPDGIDFALQNEEYQEKSI